MSGRLVQTRLPEDLAKWVAEEAKKEELSQACFLRRLVKQAREQDVVEKAANPLRRLCNKMVVSDLGIRFCNSPKGHPGDC